MVVGNNFAIATKYAEIIPVIWCKYYCEWCIVIILFFYVIPGDINQIISSVLIRLHLAVLRKNAFFSL